jgi:hypothetical protein
LLRCRCLLNVTVAPQQPAPTAQIKCPLCSEPMLIVERITGFQLLDVLTISPPKSSLDSS